MTRSACASADDTAGVDIDVDLDVDVDVDVHGDVDIDATGRVDGAYSRGTCDADVDVDIVDVGGAVCVAVTVVGSCHVVA